MGNLSWLSYLGSTSAYIRYFEHAQGSKLLKAMINMGSLEKVLTIIELLPIQSLFQLLEMPVGKKIPAMSSGKSVGHMEPFPGFYIFALVGPLAEKNEAEINGLSMKPDTRKWEMHTLWKELSKEEADTASLKIFTAGCFVDSVWLNARFRECYWDKGIHGAQMRSSSAAFWP